MVLTATTHSLEIILDKTIATELNYAVHYNDYTSTTVTPVSNYGTTNGTASVNLIPSPSTNHQHQLKYCSINNIGTQDVGTKIRINDGGLYRNLSYIFLKTSESIQYTEETGWRVCNDSGYEKTTGYQRIPPAIKMPEWFGAANITTTLTPVSATSYCMYLGRVERPYSSVKLQYFVTQSAASSIGWAEVGIYRGTPQLSSSTTVESLGYTDASSIWNSTGTKTTEIFISQSMAVGDDLWVVLNVSASTLPLFRAGLVDHLGAGFMQSASNTRISGSTTITATKSTTDAMPWIAWQGIYTGT